MQGADVNSGKHKYRYTALHFAALSGNSAVCGMLLAAGAKSELTNTVGRTASQMGAFVGKFSFPLPEVVATNIFPLFFYAI